MPYNRETAGKGGHADFVRNPDIKAFLSACEYLKPPSEEEALQITSTYLKAPISDSKNLPSFVVASDASKSDAPITDNLPSTQIGFIKVSHVLISMAKYAELVDPRSRFVDPFKAAELHRNAHPVTFVMPGSNIKYKGSATVKDGFRRALYDQLTSNMRGGGGRLMIAETLLMICNGEISIKRCPSCGEMIAELSFKHIQQIEICGYCHSEIYLTDWLRLHEGLSDFGDNSSAMTRMMNVLEHLLLVAFIYEIRETALHALSNIAFVVDGPLAIFGEPAKLHQRILAFIYQTNERLEKLGLRKMLILGLQKTGAVMDHARLLERYLANDVLRVIDDEYRRRYIVGSDATNVNFGNETYYGQDFLFKTDRGRVFNFSIPYTFESKDSSGNDFPEKKISYKLYGDLLARACDLIRHFELDLYENAIVPIALAHRHASISLLPGGKVLDILARGALAK